MKSNSQIINQIGFCENHSNVDLTSLPVARIVLILKAELFLQTTPKFGLCSKLGFGLLFRNPRHLRRNQLPSPIPFHENSQVAESPTNRTPLYMLAGLDYGYVSIDPNC